MNDKPYANEAMIKMLVNVFGVSPNEYESENEQTLLHYAAWAGNAEAAHALIDLGAEVDAKTLDGTRRFFLPCSSARSTPYGC